MIADSFSASSAESDACFTARRWLLQSPIVTFIVGVECALFVSAHQRFELRNLVVTGTVLLGVALHQSTATHLSPILSVLSQPCSRSSGFLDCVLLLVVALLNLH